MARFCLAFLSVLLINNVAFSASQEDLDKAYRTYSELFLKGKAGKAIPVIQEALQLAEELDKPAGHLAIISCDLGSALYKKKQYEAAQDALEESLRHFDDANIDTENDSYKSCEIALLRIYARSFKPDMNVNDMQSHALELANGGDLKPFPVNRVQHHYPKRAQERGQEAWVTYTFVVDQEGQAQNLQVTDFGLGRFSTSKRTGNIIEEFKKLGMEAISRYRFSPAVRDGELVISDSQEIRLEWQLGR